MNYPQNFEEKIGFDKIRKLLKNKTLSTLGAIRADEMIFYISKDIIETQLNETKEFKHICEKYDDFPTNYFFDVKPYLEKIKIENTYLTVSELFDLKRSLETIKLIILFFKNKENDEFPYLKKLIGNVMVYPFVYEKIDAIINKNGQIKDNASPELKNIRIELSSKQSTISKVINEILKRALKEGLLDEDASVTIRDGKMLIPVPSSNKRKIKGFIHDESATGKTSFIEPLESIELNNAIKELEFAERREIIKILTAFSNEIRPYISELIQNFDFLAEIDFIRAKALFSIEINAVLPKISDKNLLDYRYAIHPLLFLNFRKEKRKVIPLDLEINENQRIVLISGPNAGGKSVCLKTVGLLQYMFQSGLLIPIKETSTVGIFNNIFIDIGDEQSLENDLSTYSSHLLNMKHFVENADEKTLILIDEFGTGTEPVIGASIAESILEELNKNKTNGIITTHYTNLKHYASQTEGIVNGAMLFDSVNMQPLFQLEVGKPGSSFAFEIAAKIGLPIQIIKNAESKVGKDQVNFEKHLQEIETDRKYFKEQNRKLDQLQKDLENKIIKNESEIEFTLNQRKNILNISKEQAKNILLTANKLIENTIYEIKKVDANKELTKEIRKEFEEAKIEFIDTQEEEERKILEKIEKLKQKEKNKIENPKLPKPLKAIKPDEKVEESTIKIGDTVKIDKRENYGEIEEIKDDTAMVVMGNLRSFINLKRLEKVSKKEVKKAEKQKEQIITVNWEQNRTRDEFLFGLDIRGMRAEEALQKVMQYLDDAIVANASELKILHGTGNGILRQLIRDYLRTQPVVKSCKDERIQLGGSGITIVELDY
jgi:DNA mismatch repair protein MutS2